jgi:hypothetical protein
MALREDRRNRRSARSKSARLPAGEVTVDEEQRRRLAECCAFFMAARFRPANPGGYRARDLIEAGARIDAIVEKHKPK